MTRYDKIYEALDSLAGQYCYQQDLIDIHNEMCDQDDHIYMMSDLADVLAGTDPVDIVNMVAFGDFNPNHEWFAFNGYGNLESSEFPCAELMSISDMAREMDDNNDAYGIAEIEDILAEEDE